MPEAIDGGSGATTTPVAARPASRSIAQRWFEPVSDARRWETVGVLVLSTIAAPVFFAVALTAATVTFGLVFALFGVLLIPPTFQLIDAFVDANAAMYRKGGATLNQQPPSATSGVGLIAIRTTLADRIRWRRFVNIVANVVIAPVIGALGLAPFGLAAQLTLGWYLLPISTELDFGLGSAGRVAAFGVAAVAVGAGVRTATWAIHTRAEIDGWFLAPDRAAAAEARATELAEQRDDVLDAVAHERRRIERNLHDGVQQQLVAIGIDLSIAANHLSRDPADRDDDSDRARALIDEARSKLTGSVGELRQLARGLHPAILTDRGLDAALSATVASAPIPVAVHIDPDLDLSTDVAEALYFIVNEALANVFKHAHARIASVHVTATGSRVRASIHDDGRGGAQVGGGTGLAGIRARVAARDGAFELTSPPGGPTVLAVEVER